MANKPKSKPKTKTFSFTDDYMDVYEYLQTQSNQSRYICELIRADMKKKTNEEEILEQVKILIGQSSMIKRND